MCVYLWREQRFQLQSSLWGVSYRIEGNFARFKVVILGIRPYL